MHQQIDFHPSPAANAIILLQERVNYVRLTHPRYVPHNTNNASWKVKT
jgi:hypothetical protein